MYKTRIPTNLRGKNSKQKLKTKFKKTHTHKGEFSYHNNKKQELRN